MKKLLWIGAGVAVVVLVALALVLPRLLDPQTHHATIERALASATGREVKLGELKLHIFPAPQLVAAGLTIGEDPKFGTAPFLQTDRLEVRVRLMPLFRKSLSVETVTIERPQVRVERNREGQWNVLSIGPSSTAADASSAGQPSAPGSAGPGDAATSPPTGSASGMSVSADKIAIRGGTLTLVDAGFTEGKTITTVARDFECTLTDLSLQSAVGIDVAFELEGIGKAGLSGKVGPLSSDANGTFPFDLNVGLAKGGAGLRGKLTNTHGSPVLDARFSTKEIALAELAPVLKLLGPLLPAGLAMKGDIALDATARGRLDDPYKMSIDGTATVKGLELADPALRQPITGIRGRLTFKGNEAGIDDFGAQLGASSVTGSCAVTHFERPVINVRLASPLLDVDELLALLAPAPAAPAAPPASSPAPRKTSSSGPAPTPAQAAASPAGPVPSAIRDVTIRGEIAVTAAKVMNLKLANAKASLSMKDGIARLAGMTVDLYGGKLTGELESAVAEAGPPFTLAGQLSGVAFDPLARDLSKDLGGLLSGTLDTKLEVRGRGLDSAALSRALKGHGSLGLRDGKLTSISILSTVAKALEAAGGRGIGEKETPFRSLTGTFDIADGRATTTDLALDSPDIALHGKGWVGLDLRMDLDVAASFSPEVSADMVAKTGTLKYLQNSQGRIELDLDLAGNLAAPSVGVDRKMIDRAAKSAVKQEAVKKGTSFLEKLLNKKKK